VTREPRERWPTLARLFGAYLNQDFDEHGPDPLAAADRFREDAGADEARAAAREARALLRAARGEAALRRALDALSLGYDPAPAPLRGFLRDLARRLDEPDPR
jgi:hypothetical protein